MNETELSRVISDAALTVQRNIGAGGLEANDYLHALAYELRARGLEVSQRTIPPGSYGGVKTRKSEKIDLIVNDLVIVECRAEPRYESRFEAEALAHLRMTGLRMAVVINFGSKPLRDGIRRVMNDLPKD